VREGGREGRREGRRKERRGKQLAKDMKHRLKHPPTPFPLLSFIPPLFAQEGTLTQMGNPKKIDFEALQAMWEAGRAPRAMGGGGGGGGREGKKEEVEPQKKEDEAEEEVPVKAVQAFTLDEDF